MISQPFCPFMSIKVTAASSSATTALPGGITPPAGGFQLVIYCSANTAAIGFGDSAAKAATAAAGASWALNGYTLTAGQTRVITLPPRTTHIGYIRDGGSDATLYLTLGSGE